MAVSLRFELTATYKSEFYFSKPTLKVFILDHFIISSAAHHSHTKNSYPRKSIALPQQRINKFLISVWPTKHHQRSPKTQTYHSPNSLTQLNSQNWTISLLIYMLPVHLFRSDLHSFLSIITLGSTWILSYRGFTKPVVLLLSLWHQWQLHLAPTLHFNIPHIELKVNKLNLARP